MTHGVGPPKTDQGSLWLFSSCSCPSSLGWGQPCSPACSALRLKAPRLVGKSTALRPPSGLGFQVPLQRLEESPRSDPSGSVKTNMPARVEALSAVSWEARLQSRAPEPGIILGPYLLPCSLVLDPCISPSRGPRSESVRTLGPHRLCLNLGTASYWPCDFWQVTLSPYIFIIGL